MFWLVEVFLFKKIHTFGELLSVLLFICGEEKFIYFIPFTEQSISYLIWYSAAIESCIHLSLFPTRHGISSSQLAFKNCLKSFIINNYTWFFKHMIWKWETTKPNIDVIGYIKFYMGNKMQ